MANDAEFKPLVIDPNAPAFPSDTPDMPAPESGLTIRAYMATQLAAAILGRTDAPVEHYGRNVAVQAVFMADTLIAVLNPPLTQ